MNFRIERLGNFVELIVEEEDCENDNGGYYTISSGDLDKHDRREMAKTLIDLVFELIEIE